MKQNNGFDPDVGNGALGRALSEKISGERSGHCLSEEEISSLVDGRVAPRERKTMLIHITSCENCFQVFSLSSELSETTATRRPLLFRPLGLAASLFLVVLIALVVYKSGWLINRHQVVRESAQIRPAVEKKTKADLPPPATEKESGKTSGKITTPDAGGGSGRASAPGEKGGIKKGKVKQKAVQPEISAAKPAAKVEKLPGDNKEDIKKSSLPSKKGLVEAEEARLEKTSYRLANKRRRPDRAEGFVGGVQYRQFSYKVALLIGNSAYPEHPLARAVSMTEALAGALTSHGFDVLLITDANSESIERAIADFRSRLKKDTVALLYLNGHITEINQRLVYVPLWNPGEKQKTTVRKTIEISPDFLFGRQEVDSVNLLILETGYKTPPGFRLTENSTGLSVLPDGFLVASAVEPGRTIAGSYQQSGLFTQFIIDYLDTDTVDLNYLFQRVRVGVVEKSSGSQLPWIVSTIRQPFQFKKIDTDSL